MMHTSIVEVQQCDFGKIIVMGRPIQDTCKGQDVAFNLWSGLPCQRLLHRWWQSRGAPKPAATGAPGWKPWLQGSHGEPQTLENLRKPWCKFPRSLEFGGSDQPRPVSTAEPLLLLKSLCYQHTYRFKMTYLCFRRHAINLDCTPWFIMTHLCFRRHAIWGLSQPYLLL